MTPGVYIAQLLCPERHSMLAGFHYCEDREHLAAVVAQVYAKWDDLCAKGYAQPKCYFCLSTHLEVETGRLPFNSIEEAMPTLRAMGAVERLSGPSWKASQN